MTDCPLRPSRVITGPHFNEPMRVEDAANATDLQVELKQVLTDLGLPDSIELKQA
jgi:hypothetical protein